MEAILTAAAVVLVTIQAHRNYLMIKNASNQSSGSIPVNVKVSLELPEEYWPTVTVSNDISHELDYNKLGEAVKMALIESGVALHNAQIPVIIPNPNPQPYSGPYWQTPVVSDSVGDVNVETSNESEINGIPGRKFPAR